MNATNPYNKAFYSSYVDISVDSARRMLPIVREMVKPESVADVGCGIGTWLKAWEELGVKDVLGLDGNFIEASHLLIDHSKFKRVNLENPEAVDRRFSLAQSLEVAEHISAEHAEGFVRFLCSLSPVVLFGAAIPFQGGTFHINEQWPEYWAELFHKHGYVCCDVLRDALWHDKHCAYYYAQNTFLFIDKSALADFPALVAHAKRTDRKVLARVHPDKWIEAQHPTLEKLIRLVPGSSADFAARALRKIRRMLSAGTKDR
ncbi:MAG: class I SAM-dependent methyltransferase [Elusimicrobia bacterium]|nr:class I SAM-dependent methyltransferase [Elusimicrobiota bacterium]